MDENKFEVVDARWGCWTTCCWLKGAVRGDCVTGSSLALSFLSAKRIYSIAYIDEEVEDIGLHQHAVPLFFRFLSFNPFLRTWAASMLPLAIAY